MDGVPPVKTRRESARWKTKHSLILAAALNEFENSGLAGANMDRIATSAGVSKVTIYNHFASKLELFRATMDFHVASIHASLPRIAVGKGRSVRETLADYGLRLISGLATDEALAVMRLIQSEKPSVEGSQVAAWEAKVWPEFGVLVDFLRAEDRTGRLRVENPELAARFFYGLILGSMIYPRVMLSEAGALIPPADGDLAKTINAAINLFVLGYSP